ERWGLERAVGRFVGMFAFGLWDSQRRVLHLVRDRLGIKPLFVGRVGDGLVFGSDVASFTALPGFVRALDRDVLHGYFRFSCVPSTQCIYEGVEKVPPGFILSFDAPNGAPRRTQFWSAAEVAETGAANRSTVGVDEATDLVEEALRVAVRDRQIADVPLGVFLSGGVDSSVVAALAKASDGKTRTFSIGFHEGAYDEATHAAAVAKHLGTDHTTLYLTPTEAMDAIPRLAGIYSEPFADSSQLPTLLVCEMARRDVTVVLSGDGGDEVFGGYNRHLWGPRVWRLASSTPSFARRRLAQMLRTRSPKDWDVLLERAGRFVPPLRARTPGDKVHKLASLVETSSVDDLYDRLTSIWWSPSDVVRGGHEKHVVRPGLAAGVAEQFMLRDLVGYLHDDVLTKVDRASMSV
ncbi:asparagine synthetase B family protein, partial [Nodularia spumigena]|uniref:asparagine synthetase B family protein n=1 Tax=Nodularia spumigena TaxID=70799 RepID=UPI002B20FC2A